MNIKSQSGEGEIGCAFMILAIGVSVFLFLLVVMMKNDTGTFIKIIEVLKK